MSRRPPVPLFSDIRPLPFSLLSSHNLTMDKQTRNNSKRNNDTTSNDQAGSPEHPRTSKRSTLSDAQRPKGIQKPYFNTDRARKDGSSKTSSSSLEAILTRHAQHLVTTEQNALTSTISQHLKTFDQLTSHFNEKLDLEAKYLDEATRPMSKEEVRIQHRIPEHVRNDKTGQMEWKVNVKHEDIKVAKEMEVIRNTVVNAEDELSRLWGEWEDVQAQLLALVLEVSEEYDGTLLSLYPDPSSVLHSTLLAGVEARRAHAQANEDVGKKVGEVEEEIENNAREIKKASGELQKQYVRTVTGGLEKIQNMILGLVG